jgi:hypothetical protein
VYPYIVRLSIATLLMGIIAFGVITILTPMVMPSPLIVVRASLTFSSGLIAAVMVWIGTTMVMKIPETMGYMQQVQAWINSHLFKRYAK